MPERPKSTRTTIRQGSTARAAGRDLPARIQPVFRRLGVADRPDVGSVSSHRHVDHEVILVDHGPYSCSVNGVWIEFQPGQGVVIKPGDWHEDRFNGPHRYFGLSFVLDADPLRPAPPSLFVPDVTVERQRFRMDMDRTWALVRGLQQEGDAPDRVSGHMQDALLLVFFWQMVRALPVEGLNQAFLDLSGDQTLPSQILRLFRARVAEDLSVADMAASLHMSESSLSHKCTELLGLPPRKAFLKCKMERAQYLLVNTGQPIKEIAAEVGFEDPYAFSRAFKTVCGVSPAHWRDRQG